MSETPVLPYGGSYTQLDRDAEHLRILAICHYVAAGLTMLFSCVFIIYIVLGVAMLLGKMPMNNRNAAPMPPGQEKIVGYMFAGIGSVAFVLGWTAAILMIISGRSMTRRRNRIFSLVVAGISCAIMPIGTVLGVFTLVVLLRDSVRARYRSEA